MTHSVPEAQAGGRGGRTALDTATLEPPLPSRTSRLRMRLQSTPPWRRPHLQAREVALVAAVFLVYQGLRGNSPARVDLAFSNAALIERIERWMSIDIELTVNQFFVATPWLAHAASLWYQIAHVAVTVATLLWLWVRHHGLYDRLRSTLAVTTLAGLCVYWMFPLAPPRFALEGAVDTMHVDPVLFAGAPQVNGWANLYAAMPSIHVAWAFWCALAVVVAARGTWRHLAWAYPATTIVVVVGTANHYLLDVVAGIALVVVSYRVVCVLADRAGALLRARQATMVT